MGEFSDKLAVVTGGAQGIGRAIGEHLHAAGAQLVLVDINEAKLGDAAAAMRAEHRPSVDTIVADLGNPEAIQRVCEEIAARNVPIDVLVNNAAIERDLPFSQVTSTIFDQIIAVNLRAPLLLSQALASLFSPSGGAIVNISSVHAEHAFPNSIPYACSKAGLVALTRNMALELAPRNIRVNAICPGYIDTAMWDEWLSTVPHPEELARQTTALHPLGRRGVPADVASAAAYFASEQSAWVTGTHLVVDGGLTIRAHP
ncbi:SDR family NAD(P)-dependent oxidoreductase [Acidicapsa dinghuensis]|uniref:SDR family NAD(P)-dependent oxidoreductase n=1 Tax=Acidicapsa dinghuensis TaxID=2218256 RepID=A0ABW1EK50_9BACT|nr:SDR family oxidoreductase [Acidicapsa dinghuensis]